ncbi:MULTISPECIES: hypothetical protein [Cysteiniphilum]|uniref:Outer membrane protein beta-barrel domain-containing protein n=1 Tax=Cysteiniphilum litorale TaxID=2056700 RepID=A0A8J3E8S3_9GAMM|nr:MULTISPECIES: hypothetical protein [Cysteiniphilum]GGF93734.1 hypothetical protein GCM10010995_08660 [Cysteiniphilum litorale]
MMIKRKTKQIIQVAVVAGCISTVTLLLPNIVNAERQDMAVNGVFNQEYMGYQTALNHNNFLMVNGGFSVFGTPSGANSSSQIPLALNIGGGQRSKLTDRIYLGYELALGHLGSQKVTTNDSHTMHQFELSAVATGTFFFNPYLEMHLKGGLGYQLNLGSPSAMKGVNVVLGAGSGFYINSDNVVTADLTYYSGSNALDSAQRFTTITVGISHYF